MHPPLVRIRAGQSTEKHVTFSPGASQNVTNLAKTAWQHAIRRVGTALALSPPSPGNVLVN